MAGYQVIYDILGRKVVNPYPELNGYWFRPLALWKTLKRHYEGIDDPRVLYGALTADLILNTAVQYIEDVPRSPDDQEDGWVMASHTYYLPAPNAPLLIAIKVPQEYKKVLYFTAEGQLLEDGHAYLDKPSVSYTNPTFVATGLISPQDVWAKRITRTNRRAEMRSGQHQHFLVKPFPETQALYKCVPECTFLIQDCHFSQDIKGGAPEILGNKQLIIMFDDTAQEPRHVAPEQ
jgi:hypothetical protein